MYKRYLYYLNITYMLYKLHLQDPRKAPISRTIRTRVCRSSIRTHRNLLPQHLRLVDTQHRSSSDVAPGARGRELYHRRSGCGRECDPRRPADSPCVISGGFSAVFDWRNSARQEQGRIDQRTLTSPSTASLQQRIYDRYS